MKKILFFTFFISLPLISLSQYDDDFAWELLGEVELDRYFRNKTFLQKEYAEKNLKKSKVLLLSGDFSRALFYLQKVKENYPTFYQIRRRYEALIYFLLEEYDKSIEIYNSPFFYQANYYPEICVLKSLNLFSLKRLVELNEEFERCILATSRFTRNQHYWFETLINFKLKGLFPNRKETLLTFQNILEEKELISLWLKKALYTNKEKNIIDKLSLLPQKAYRSKKIREIIGFLYYRLGKDKEALSFIEDVKTPNAENLKGNISLEKKEYELAYGHFQLALKKKANSVNSLERAIPLAWILKKWETGEGLLRLRIGKEVDIYKKMTLETAFLIRQKKFFKALKNLKILNKRYSGRLPFVISLMNSYVSFMMDDMIGLRKYASKACRKFDGINCWILSQSLSWQNFSKTIKGPKKSYSDLKLTLDALKEPYSPNPMKEDLILDQKDIEELDSDLVRFEINRDG